MIVGCPGVVDADDPQIDPAAAVSLVPLARGERQRWLEGTSPAIARWVGSAGFSGEPGEVCLIPNLETGGASFALIGVGSGAPVWDWAAVASRLPAGLYRLDAPLVPADAEAAAFGWSMAHYAFRRYRACEPLRAKLLWPTAGRRAAVIRAVEATYFVRDLINTPASDMGPQELADAAAELARRHGADIRTIVGADLLTQNYPAVHAVGRASARAPRLIDLNWGAPERPKVTLVGKGVCFDTGGLDLKPSSAMQLMKKDMGGAATVLGLGHMIMSADLPVRLRILIPAVENSVSGDAMRPLDVVRTRKGITVEIGNTDAEGRVILADALAEAAIDQPALLIDFATLTGAARVALGAEIAAMFSPDDRLARDLEEAGRSAGDPLWRLPLWPPYRRHLEGKTADLTNAPASPYAGAILAALFLAEFVEPVKMWAHLDVMAWNPDSRPGRPEGGEAMGMRALYALIEARWPR